ncbi:unnamed protein product, partial [Protopolystoma xenopodis]
MPHSGDPFTCTLRLGKFPQPTWAVRGHSDVSAFRPVPVRPVSPLRSPASRTHPTVTKDADRPATLQLTRSHQTLKPRYMLSILIMKRVPTEPAACLG